MLPRWWTSMSSLNTVDWDCTLGVYNVITTAKRLQFSTAECIGERGRTFGSRISQTVARLFESILVKVLEVQWVHSTNVSLRSIFYRKGGRNTCTSVYNNAYSTWVDRCAAHRFSAKSKGRKNNLRPCLIKSDVSALFLAPNLHLFHRLYIAGGQYRKRKA